LGAVKILVEIGTDINSIDFENTTPLFIACQNGHYEVVEFLLKHGADRNITFRWTTLPQSVARKNGHKKIVDILNFY
jgi:ankyrin repeat protein